MKYYVKYKSYSDWKIDAKWSIGAIATDSLLDAKNKVLELMSAERKAMSKAYTDLKKTKEIVCQS